MISRFKKISMYILAMSALLIMASCANISVKTIPPLSSSTAKLRVCVHPITGQGNWGTPYESFVGKQLRRVKRILDETGIYDVVPESDVRAALGNQNPTRWEMARNGWALAREIGRALHADYVMIAERSSEKSGFGGSDFLFGNIMINTETGKTFEAKARIGKFNRADWEHKGVIMKRTYRDLFMSAKEDMLAVAIRKSREYDRNQRTASAGKDRVVTPSGALNKDTENDSAEEDYENLEIIGEIRASGADRLAIYDFDAPEQFKTVALILTEALREELFRLNRFILVNRETLQKVLREVALQQSGLTDEKQAVKTGKGLSANQVMTGNLGLLGKTFILQAKRIDVETFATLGLVSAKFAEGQEEDVLSKLPGLAKSLAGMQ